MRRDPRERGLQRRSGDAALSPWLILIGLILLGVALAMMLFCGWRGARPPDPMKGPRMMPWRFIMIGAAAAGRRRGSNVAISTPPTAASR